MRACLAIRALLLRHPQAVSLLGGVRVYQSAAPQGAPKPYAVLGLIDGRPEHHLRGQAGGLRTDRVQVDTTAETWDASAALFELVRGACDGYRGVIPNNGDPIDVRHCTIDSDACSTLSPESGKGLPLYQTSHELLVATFESIPTF